MWVLVTQSVEQKVRNRHAQLDPSHVVEPLGVVEAALRDA
jgi:hypothetical protein